MDIQILASSSAGNCVVIDDGYTKLMLDCGLRKNELRRKYSGKLSGISAVLVTHEHKDHSKGVCDMISISKPVYMSCGTKNALGIENNLIKTVQSGKVFNAGTFSIMPFNVEHDCAEPLGFLTVSIKTGEKLLFITDTKYIRYKFSGIDYLLIECNYSQEIINRNVERGVLTASLAKRIVGSHFGLDNVAGMIKTMDKTRLKAVYLLHLSDSNSDEKLFRQKIQNISPCPVYVGQK